MKTAFTALAALTLLGGCTQVTASEDAGGVDREMIDRMAITDLLNRYYAEFGAESAIGFNDYYTDDAVFDVNGQVANGKAEIQKIYAGIGEDSPSNDGTFHMLMTNPVIDIKGDTATAKLLWTGILNDSIDGPPKFVEQGREYDKLVKKDGKWLIQHRVVVADSGLPPFMKATYTPRMDYDISKE
jgi:ketosteroid isomerase-like protein